MLSATDWNRINHPFMQNRGSNTNNKSIKSLHKHTTRPVQQNNSFETEDIELAGLIL